MKTIKIMDLLNKIANGEEVPKRIKYKNEIRDYVDEDKDYICRDSKNFYLFYDILTKGTGEKFKNALNDEVEIIEEDKKIPEKLDYCEENTFSIRQTGMTKEDRRLLDSNFKELGNKINSIIDYLESKEKGDE